MNRRLLSIAAPQIVALSLLVATTFPAFAQQRSSATGGMNSGGGGGGSGGGAGGGGGGAGGSGGSSTSSGSFSPVLTSGTLGTQSGISAGGGSGGGATAGGGANSISSGVSTSNIFSTNYNNPMSGGVTATRGGGRFGAPLFGNLTQANNGTVSVTIGGTGGGLGMGGAGAGLGLGGTSYGPYPLKVPDFSAAQNMPSKLHTELQQILGRSSSLSAGKNIQVLVVGDAVMLRGKVANDRERRLAESLVWLTPGVSEVHNELTLP